MISSELFGCGAGELPYDLARGVVDEYPRKVLRENLGEFSKKNVTFLCLGGPISKVFVEV